MRNTLYLVCFLLFSIPTWAQDNTLATNAAKVDCSALLLPPPNDDPPAKSKTLDLLGRPRTPLKNSFYNRYMWDFDGFQSSFRGLYTERNFSLIGLGRQIPTRGKTIVYDASTLQLTTPSDVRAIRVSATEVTFQNEGKTYLVPIKRSGDADGATRLSPQERKLIAEYVDEALGISGATPSSVELRYRGKDFDLTVHKSELSGESFIVRGFNLGTRAESASLRSRIAALREQGNFAEAKKVAESVSPSSPERAYFEKAAQELNELVSLGEVNTTNPESRLLKVQESSTGFLVSDGMNKSKYFASINKDAFTTNLRQSLGPEVRTLHLEVRGLPPAKADAFIETVKTQMAIKRSELKVARRSDLSPNLLFRPSKITPTSKNISYPEITVAQKNYVASQTGESATFSLSMKLQQSFTNSKFKTIAKRFFKLFETNTQTPQQILNRSVLKAKKQLQQKYPQLEGQQLETFIRDELGRQNFVLEMTLDEERFLVQVSVD